MDVDIIKFKELFFVNLNTKTSWGKEQVKDVFKDTLVEYLENRHRSN